MPWGGDLLRMEQEGETELLVTAKNCRTLIGKRIIVPSKDVKTNVESDKKKDTKNKDSTKLEKSDKEEKSIQDKSSENSDKEKAQEKSDLDSSDKDKKVEETDKVGPIQSQDTDKATLNEEDNSKEDQIENNPEGSKSTTEISETSKISETQQINDVEELSKSNVIKAKLENENNQ